MIVYWSDFHNGRSRWLCSWKNVCIRSPAKIKRWLDAKVAAGDFSTRTEAIVYYLTAEMVREEQPEIDLEKIKQDIIDSASKEIARELIEELDRKK